MPPEIEDNECQKQISIPLLNRGFSGFDEFFTGFCVSVEVLHEWNFSEKCDGLNGFYVFFEWDRKRIIRMDKYKGQ